MEQTITGRYIESIWTFSKRDLPTDVVHEICTCLMDYLACANLGSHLLRNEIQKYLDFFGGADGNASVIGVGRKADVLTAALVNGISAHEPELDDGHRYAMLHPGVPVISAVLAMAQDHGCGAENILRGIITGYEATIRLAGAIQPGHKLKGYHATGTCGTIGAAIGVAAMLDYPKELWNTVVSAAATSAAGLLQVIDDQSELKPFNAGRAAQGAVSAACFGITDLRGPEDVLGGKRGFFATAAESVDEEYLLNGNGRNAIQSIYRKPYAACRHSHAAIEATLILRGKEKIAPEEIERIEVITYGLAVKGHDQIKIEGASSAKMSIPYGVAAAIRYGKVDFQQYNEACLTDDELHALMKRVTVREDPELSKLVPGKRTAIVKIITSKDEYAQRVEYPLGEPENPMNREMMESKYHSMMKAAGRTTKDAEAILECLNHFETMKDALFERM